MAPNEKPTSSQWTLRLKHSKLTILLYTTPSTPLTDLKSELLSALRATGLTSLPPDHTPLPSSPDDVILGVPLDAHDLSKGWVDLLIPEVEDEDGGDGEGSDGEGGGGKGKSKSGKSKSGMVQKGSVLNESPLGAGLKDGATLAFRVRGEEGFEVVVPRLEEDGGEGEG